VVSFLPLPLRGRGAQKNPEVDMGEVAERLEKIKEYL
jgi:hypothetical protein